MKHHEVIIDFNRRGLVTFVRGLFAKTRDVEPSQGAEIVSTPIMTSEPYRLDTSIKVSADADGGVTAVKKRASR